ncbi:MAG: MFS transporter [Pirellulaceae bacterium]
MAQHPPCRLARRKCISGNYCHCHDLRGLEYKVALTFIPTVIYGILLFGCKFPQSERVQAGISYREMLSDFGGLGAFLSVFLISIQIFDIAKPEGWTPIDNATYALIPGLIAGLAFGFSIKSLGQPIFFILCLLMIPLATTELGIDSWSAELLKPAMQDIGLEAGWVLVYTMGIMTVLRFFAGPIVHKITPLALLAGSAAVAAIGLVFLSKATAIGILAAATVYGLGKTFFWPTMLAVVAEKFPKGGALTLNSVGGVGMLGLGIGSLFLGQIQDESISTALIQKGEVYEQLLKEPESGVLGEYQALDTDKVAEATEAEQAVVEETQNTAKKDALMTAAIFPVIMFLSYVGLVLYYKSPVTRDQHHCSIMLTMMLLHRPRKLQLERQITQAKSLRKSLRPMRAMLKQRRAEKSKLFSDLL